MREAVIAAQVTLNIVVATLWLISYGTGYYKNFYANETSVEEAIADAYKNVAIIVGVGMGIAFFAIIGAVRYNVWLVLLGAIYAIIECVLNTMYVYPVLKDAGAYAPGWYIALPVLYALLVLYPSLVYVYEVKKGILEPKVGGDGKITFPSFRITI